MATRLGIDDYFICPTCGAGVDGPTYLKFEGGEMYYCEECHGRFSEDEL